MENGQAKVKIWNLDLKSPQINMRKKFLGVFERC